MANILSTPSLQPSPFHLPSPQQVIPSTQLAKLPPIPSSLENPDLLHVAKSELKDSMQHLLQEAQSTETRMQTAIETLWRKMLELMDCKEKDFKKQLTEEQEKLAAATAQVCKLTEREILLASQNAKLSTEIVAAEKQQQVLNDELYKIKNELKSKDTELCSLSEDSKSIQQKCAAEINTLKKIGVEQSKTIKEFQEKIYKMTDKVQKLSKELCAERESSQQVQKTSLSKLNQKTSENHKMTLEISKLKAQLASSTTTLSTAKEEAKKLKMQLNSETGDFEALVQSLNNKHDTQTKLLEEKIQLLEEELVKQQKIHEKEILALNEKLHSALHSNGTEDDDYMLARIKFLQHQNQQEKVRLWQQKSKS